jgi:hypothetical protein
MAEQDIISKHTKKAIAAALQPDRSFWQKGRELGMEVVIIVFAVSLSMWLHGVGEHLHEQQQVKAFLLGLKIDLQSDTEELRSIISTNRKNDEAYRYLAGLEPGVEPDKNRFIATYRVTGSSVVFVPQSSRYEGFKSSGRLISIEDPVLLQKVLGLYQQSLPMIHLAETAARDGQTRLRTYLENGIEKGDGAERYRLVLAPRGKHLCLNMITSPELYTRYAQAIEVDKHIIARIDALYAN